MHLEALLIAHPQQGRILQVFPVVLQAGGKLQVFMLALVLPREESALPYVRIVFAPFELRDVFLKGLAVSGLVCGGGVRLSQHFA
jgi:hypothetical protein